MQQKQSCKKQDKDEKDKERKLKILLNFIEIGIFQLNFTGVSFVGFELYTISFLFFMDFKFFTI